MNRPTFLHIALAASLAFVAHVTSISISPARADGNADLAGTWTWSWKDGEGKEHKHVLDIEAAGGKLTGRERFDGEPSIKVDDLKLEGETLYFSTKREDRRASYKGKLVGRNTVNGVVNVATNGQGNEFQWTAERAIQPKKE